MKKIILYFVIINLFIISLAIIIFINKQEKPDFKSLENNIVKIIKEQDIISNLENPRGIFGTDGSSSEIISSGFFINKNTIITVAHGVNNSENIYKIIDNFGNTYDGYLVKKDIKNDLAFLEIKETFKYFKSFNYAKNTNIGLEIGSFGLEKNKIKIGEIIEVKNDIIYSSIIFESGESGGIMFNSNYEIIGINQAVDFKKMLGITQKIKDDLY